MYIYIYIYIYTYIYIYILYIYLVISTITLIFQSISNTQKKRKLFAPRAWNTASRHPSGAPDVFPWWTPSLFGDQVSHFRTPILDGSWGCMMVYDDLWWCMMIHDDVWVGSKWSSMDFNGFGYLLTSSWVEPATELDHLRRKCRYIFHSIHSLW